MWRPTVPKPAMVKFLKPDMILLVDALVGVFYTNNTVLITQLGDR